MEVTQAQDPEKAPEKRERVVPAGCLLRLPVARGQMSWQCIVHCIGMASGTQSHPPANPCPPRNGPSLCQALPNLRRPRTAAAEKGCQLTHKGPIRRRARHLHASSPLSIAAVARSGPPSQHQGCHVQPPCSPCLSLCLSVCPLLCLFLSISAGPPSAPISHVKTPLSQWLWQRGRARSIGAAAVRCSFAAPSCAASSDMQHQQKQPCVCRGYMYLQQMYVFAGSQIL